MIYVCVSVCIYVISSFTHCFMFLGWMKEVSWKLTPSIIFCCEKNHVELIESWKHIAHQLQTSLLLALQCNDPVVFCLLLSTGENYDRHPNSYSAKNLFAFIMI